MTTLSLVPGWDAALTYDLLERRDGQSADSSAAPVFVGREDLLGSLENAISRPDQRGTYLISGYRGAGKSSLVIEAARRAQARLAERTYTPRAGRTAQNDARRRSRRRPEPPAPEGTYRLLPLVLNVSEVSASLEPVDSGESLPLGIDARRVLTALLRSLHQALDRLFPEPSEDERELIGSVNAAYDKARAAQFSQTAQQRAESLRSREAQSHRSAEVANLLKVVAALAALAVVALEGVALLEASTAAIQVVCATLAGLAVISYRTAVTTQSKTSEQDSTQRELVFDNSLHQVETDLKDILSDFAEHGIRTMFVLEELDKLKDDKGEQLDAVIRYFKNLFTQAPALFFFLTDKEYFDIIDGNIARSRYKREYAIEHTFFTHRIFVTRPRLEECLDYFDRVLVDEEAKQTVRQIRDSTDARARAWVDMTPVEQFLRVLLFRAQNHLFDLKIAMRGYVRVDDEGSRLEFDDDSLPEQERALAGFHFLLEQKARLYHFGGGRDYPNELLRNSLSSVFADMGDTEPHSIQALYPDEYGAGTPLTLAEHTTIVRAVDSLLGDLARGGAIDMHAATADATDEAGSFRWRPKALFEFVPSPELEAHEVRLLEQLERASRITVQFREGGALHAVAGPAGSDIERLTAFHAAMVEQIRQAPRPLSSEDADQRSGQVVKDLAPLLTTARAEHQAQLTARGWRLQPIQTRTEGNVFFVWGLGGESRPGRMLLVYGAEANLYQTVQSALATTTGAPPTPVAVVLVEEDFEMPEEALEALLSSWREALGPAVAPAPVSIAVVPLSEQLDPGSLEAAWGERASDEFVMAQLWMAEWMGRLADPPVPTPAPLTGARGPGRATGPPAWLATSTSPELRYESVSSAAQAWLGGGDRALATPSTALPETVNAIATAFVENPVTTKGPRLLAEPARSQSLGAVVPSAIDVAALDERLRRRGRLLSAHVGQLDAGAIQRSLAAPDARAVLIGAALTGPLGDMSMSTLRLDQPGSVRALAQFLEAHDRERASSLFTEAAEAGDPYAIAALIGRLSGAGDRDEAERWVTQLIDTGAWDAVRTAGTANLGDPALATRLLEAAAEGGDARAMAILVGRGNDPERWEQSLLQSQDWEAVRQLGANTPDQEQALRLLEAAAEQDDVEAMSLLVTSSRFDRDVSDRWMPRLIDAGNSFSLWTSALRLDDSDPERALALHRAAADAGDQDSMLEVLVRAAVTDPDASRENQARLAELGDSRRLANAAERLAEEHPDRAEELRALATEAQR